MLHQYRFEVAQSFSGEAMLAFTFNHLHPMKNFVLPLAFFGFSFVCEAQNDYLINAAKVVMANNGYYHYNTKTCLLTEGNKCYFSEWMYNGNGYCAIAVGETGIYDLDIYATTSGGVEFVSDRRYNDNGTAVIEFQKFANDYVFFYVTNSDAYYPYYMYAITILIGYR